MRPGHLANVHDRAPCRFPFRNGEPRHRRTKVRSPACANGTSRDNHRVKIRGRDFRQKTARRPWQVPQPHASRSDGRQSPRRWRCCDGKASRMTAGGTDGRPSLSLVAVSRVTARGRRGDAGARMAAPDASCQVAGWHDGTLADGPPEPGCRVSLQSGLNRGVCSTFPPTGVPSRSATIRYRDSFPSSTVSCSKWPRPRIAELCTCCRRASSSAVMMARWTLAAFGAGVGGYRLGHRRALDADAGELQACAGAARPDSCRPA